MTFSIIVRDPQTGLFGIGIASRSPLVARAIRILPGRGAFVVQGHMDDEAGVFASLVHALHSNAGAEQAVAHAVQKDPGNASRQIALMDMSGHSMAWTGPVCGAWSGQMRAPNISLQGNLLAGPEVLDHMGHAFQASHGTLQARLLAALAAGASAGGDRRGTHAAAIAVQDHSPGGFTITEKSGSPNPIAELRAKLNRVMSHPGAGILSSAAPRGQGLLAR